MALPERRGGAGRCVVSFGRGAMAGTSSFAGTDGDLDCFPSSDLPLVLGLCGLGLAGCRVYFYGLDWC